MSLRSNDTIGWIERRAPLGKDRSETQPYQPCPPPPPFMGLFDSYASEKEG
jgi:hypothetical protein